MNTNEVMYTVQLFVHVEMLKS